MCAGKGCGKEKAIGQVSLECSCPKKSCRHHGICCQCVAVHVRKARKPPHCLMFLSGARPGPGS